MRFRKIWQGSLWQSQQRVLQSVLKSGRDMGSTVWGLKVPTLKGTEASLSYIQCFLHLVSSSVNVYVFLITWLGNFWTDLICRLWCRLCWETLICLVYFSVSKGAVETGHPLPHKIFSHRASQTLLALCSPASFVYNFCYFPRDVFQRVDTCVLYIYKSWMTLSANVRNLERECRKYLNPNQHYFEKLLL